MSGITEQFTCVECGRQQTVTQMVGSPAPTRCDDCDKWRFDVRLLVMACRDLADGLYRRGVRPASAEGSKHFEAIAQKWPFKDAARWAAIAEKFRNAAEMNRETCERLLRTNSALQALVEHQREQLEALRPPEAQSPVAGRVADAGPQETSPAPESTNEPPEPPQ